MEWPEVASTTCMELYRLIFSNCSSSFTSRLQKKLTLIQTSKYHRKMWKEKRQHGGGYQRCTGAIGVGVGNDGMADMWAVPKLLMEVCLNDLRNYLCWRNA